MACAQPEWLPDLGFPKLRAFPQRIVNGGGRIGQEYGLGRPRTDLLVVWPVVSPGRRIVLELKLQHGGREDTISRGLAQTAEYLERCGDREGHLVIFDRCENVPWSEKIYPMARKHAGYKLAL